MLRLASRLRLDYPGAPSSRAFEFLNKHLKGRADPFQGTSVLLPLSFPMLFN